MGSYNSNQCIHPSLPWFVLPLSEHFVLLTPIKGTTNMCLPLSWLLIHPNLRLLVYWGVSYPNLGVEFYKK